MFITADGGTGTTLQQHHNASLHSSLWSSELILNQPHLLEQLHRDWETAGAQVVSTATYQATLDQFQSVLGSESTDDGPTTRRDSIRYMRSAVDIVARGVQSKTKISLSLGPYGATLTPSQDYTGLYPDPGTHQHVGDASLREESYLTEFHYDRLRIFRDDPVTWGKIHTVLFETIPNLNEVRAIRRAWKMLEEACGRCEKPFVISMVFPGPHGEFPTGETADQVLETALNESDSTTYSKPKGIGINCTKLEKLPYILDPWSKQAELDLSDTWLWVYPDGGPTYDPVSRSWDRGDSLLPQLWARRLVDTACKFSGPWAGLVLGGCCNTSPDHIQQLAQLAHS